MKGLTIINQNGKLLVDSREVAEMTGKNHADLLRSIKGYVSILTESNFALSDFFIENTYKDSTGRELPCFLLTRKGCDMVANKMTGEKGVLFTAAYVTKFEEMEKQQYPQLSKELQAIFAIDIKQQEVEKRINKLESDLPLFNVECKEIQALVKKVGTRILGGYHSKAYNDNSIRQKVYTDIQHQLKREFGVSRYEAIKRCQLETAMEIVENYKAPLVLASEIRDINNQIGFDKEVV